MFAFRVVGAADKFAVTSFFIHQLATVFGTETTFDYGRLFGFFGRVFGGFAHIAGVVAIGVARAGDKAAAFAEFDLQLVVAAFGTDFFQLFGGDFGALDAFFFLHLLIEAFPKLAHYRHPLALATGNVIELVFELGGEMVIDVLGEMLGEEFVDNIAGIGGHKAFLLKCDVFAVFERGNNAGIGGRSADAEFFQRFHQRGFVVARRRAGEVLFAVERIHGQHFALFHFGQFFVVFVFVALIGALFIHAQKAGKGLHLAGDAENALTHGDIDGGLVEFGRRHLAGHGALPNHLVKLELVGAQKRFHALGRTVYGSWADGFMRFLCVFGFGFVLLGRCGQIIFADFVFDIVADFGERFVGKGHAVGTHIGNQADSALSHIDAFIQLLRGAHGAVGGHAQLAHGILLHGGGGERRGGVAAAFFLFHCGHLRFFAFQCFQHIGLRCFIGQGKLLELVAFVLNQLGGEFAAAFVAVEMQRPVFLRFKGADFVFALANQAQSGALHAAGAQTAADFFPQ